MGLLFEWDQDKASSNEAKHGISFDEAQTVFADPLASTIYDPDHSDDEDRYLSLGMSGRSRILVVSFTDRDDRIRIISARVASRKERKQYEEANET
ncbi:MAG: BrnT family toxin [Pirellulaceae bacterium]|nr:BrnT family toxin [Pirellulaceae bacterium]